MSIPVAEKPYWIEPDLLMRIGGAISEPLAEGKPFSVACKQAAAFITRSVEVEGIEHVPHKGPVIAVKSHPCHFDFLLAADVFAVREDMRWLAKVTPWTAGLPTTHVIPLRKTGTHAHPDDVTALQAYLREGGSMMATPWGSLDHEARAGVPVERAIQNTLRYLDFAQATLLPVTIDVIPGDAGLLPLESAHVTIHEPIEANGKGMHFAKIAAAVTDMYERYTV